jgi:hypothetical protein
VARTLLTSRIGAPWGCIWHPDLSPRKDSQSRFCRDRVLPQCATVPCTGATRRSRDGETPMRRPSPQPRRPRMMAASVWVKAPLLPAPSARGRCCAPTRVSRRHGPCRRHAPPAAAQRAGKTPCTCTGVARRQPLATRRQEPHTPVPARPPPAARQSAGKTPRTCTGWPTAGRSPTHRQDLMHLYRVARRRPLANASARTPCTCTG